MTLSSSRLDQVSYANRLQHAFVLLVLFVWLCKLVSDADSFEEGVLSFRSFSTWVRPMSIGE